MAENKIKAVLFDLDMTLLDLFTPKDEAIKAALSAMFDAGLDMDKEEAFIKLKKEYNKDFEGPLVISNFLNNVKQYHPKILAAAINSYRTTKAGLLKPYPEVIDTLTKLKATGLKLAIVTDAPVLKAYRRLDSVGVTEFFDIVVTVTDTGKKKPSPEPFTEALKRLNLTKEEVIHVGDWPERDIKGANEFGMISVHAKYGDIFSNSSYKGKADFEIESFSQLLGVIHTINQKA